MSTSNGSTDYVVCGPGDDVGKTDCFLSVSHSTSKQPIHVSGGNQNGMKDTFRTYLPVGTTRMYTFDLP